MANTYKGRKIYVCSTPQPADLNLSGYQALTYVEVQHVGTVGVAGTATNIVNYDELATTVEAKAKAISNAGDPVIDVARNPTDAGQIIMRAIALTNQTYAFKIEDADAPSAGYTNTIYYNRGVVSGPSRPGGRNQDFILERYTLGFVQLEIVVDPTTAVAPNNLLRPAVSGIAQTGTTLTALDGLWDTAATYTYQWQHDTAGNNTFTNISAATSKTFLCVVGDVGNCLRINVTATNAGGSTTASSAPTKAQLA